MGKDARFGLLWCLVLTAPLALSGCQMLPTQLASWHKPITTSTADAYPVSSWLDSTLEERQPQVLAGNTISPGYYTVDIQSYCLHAGAWGPTKGAGYEIGPVRGRTAAAVSGVIRRSAQYPEIAQQDVQRLIWIMEANGLNGSLDPSFAARVAPLLQDIPTLISAAGSISGLKELLPSGLQVALDRYGSLQQQLTDMSVSFSELERMAVPVAPAGIRTIEPGHWAYVQEGYYLRAFPHAYSKTTLEILRPAPYSLTRDPMGRMRTLVIGDSRIEPIYDKTVFRRAAPDGRGIRAWRVTGVKISTPQGMRWVETKILVPSDSSWTGVAPQTNTESTVRSGYSLRQEFSRRGQGSQTQGTQEVDGNTDGTADLQEIQDYLDRLDRIRDTWDAISDTRSQLEQARNPSEQAIHDLSDIGFFLEGLEAAVSMDRQSGGIWISQLLTRVSNAYFYAGCVLEGRCPPPGMDYADPAFDPSGLAAIPGANGAQRLGLSSRRSDSGR